MVCFVKNNNLKKHDAPFRPGFDANAPKGSPVSLWTKPRIRTDSLTQPIYFSKILAYFIETVGGTVRFFLSKKHPEEAPHATL